MYKKHLLCALTVALPLMLFVGCQKPEKGVAKATGENTSAVTDVTDTGVSDETKLPITAASRRATTVTVSAEVDAGEIFFGTTVAKPTVKTATKTDGSGISASRPAPSVPTTQTDKTAAPTTQTGGTVAPTTAPTASGVQDANGDGWIDGWYRPKVN